MITFGIGLQRRRVVGAKIARRNGVDIDANQWPTEFAAEEAAEALRSVGIGDRPGDEWRVVNVEDLDSYELTA